MVCRDRKAGQGDEGPARRSDPRHYPRFRLAQIDALGRSFAQHGEPALGAPAFGILGEELVDCEIDGIASGYATRGHRFHCPGEITIGGVDDYQGKLRACHVIVDHEERAALIREGAATVAADAGLVLVEDEGLVIENAGLTEWPVPLLGRFDEAFLDVPPEVIQLTARVNQKYFVCRKPSPLEGRGLGEGAVLANAFICTANIDAEDPAVVVDGNRKVLAARLSDARFFWEQDQKTPLAEHAKKLERITFHEKLGTVADKVERVAKLARWLCEEGIVKADPDLAEQAARLCKADLVTEMVGEFPELQGLMGGYYARAEGLPDAVADAIRDHYKPVGQGDEVPTAPVTVAVSLADKLDTLSAFFGIEEKPTGSKDPFALRRAVLAIVALISKNSLRASLATIFAKQPVFAPDTDAFAIFERIYGETFTRRLEPDTAEKQGRAVLEGIVNDVIGFVIDRLKVQQREAGVRHDLIDAVFALGGEDDLVRLLARVNALQAFVTTEDGANLLAGYKRAANILKKEDWHGSRGEIRSTGDEDPLEDVDDPQMREIYAEQLSPLSYTLEDAEKALIDALDAAEPKAVTAIEAEDFAAAMSALASLRAPIDRFFEEVIVNAEEKHVRAARLDLLARLRGAVHQVADFSRIEG